MALLARAVKVTLGPRGRNVIIEKKYGAPVVTKDGVTVAKEIELKDSWENMGAQMVKEVASKTSDVAGDGTTTATVLAEAIFTEGLKNVVAGANPMALLRGIEQGVAAVVENLKGMAVKVKGEKEIAQVGAIAANNDKEWRHDRRGDEAGGQGRRDHLRGRQESEDRGGGVRMQFDKGYLSRISSRTSRGRSACWTSRTSCSTRRRSAP